MALRMHRANAVVKQSLAIRALLVLVFSDAHGSIQVGDPAVVDFLGQTRREIGFAS